MRFASTPVLDNAGTSRVDFHNKVASNRRSHSLIGGRILFHLVHVRFVELTAGPQLDTRLSLESKSLLVYTALLAAETFIDFPRISSN